MTGAAIRPKLERVLQKLLIPHDRLVRRPWPLIVLPAWRCEFFVLPAA